MHTIKSKPRQKTEQLAYELVDDAELERVVGGAAVAIPSILKNSRLLAADDAASSLGTSMGF
jgi:hypothetical protein